MPVLCRTSRGILLAGEIQLNQDLEIVYAPSKEELTRVVEAQLERIPYLVYADREELEAKGFEPITLWEAPVPLSEEEQSAGLTPVGVLRERKREYTTAETEMASEGGAQVMAEEILVDDREMVTLAELAPPTEQFLNYYDDLQELADGMQRFEKIYGFSSDEFYTRWKAGQLGDDADFFEWYAYCESHRRVTQKILKLGEKLYVALSDLLSRSVEKQGTDVGAY